MCLLGGCLTLFPGSGNGGGGCGPVATQPPARLSHTLDPFTLDADSVAGTFTVLQDGRVLAQLHIGDVAFRNGVATYDMQFGMFDIQESALDWVPAARFELEPEGLLTQGLGDIKFNVFAQDGQLLATGSLGATVERKATITFDAVNASHNRSRLALTCQPTDHFNGLGAQTHDVDHRGQRVPLWVSEQGIGKTDDDALPVVWQLTGRRHSTHIPIPAVVVSRGTAWLLDTTAYAVMDLCATRADRAEMEAWEGTITLRVFAGDTPLEALEHLTTHVGRPQLPAPWAFAPWNDAVFGTETVRQFAQWLRANAIPSSAIWSEDWKGAETNGDLYTLSENWNLDPTLYPDATILASDLRTLGMAWQLYRNPFLYLDADVYPEASALALQTPQGAPYATTGAKFTDTAFLDLTNPQTRAWVKGKLQDMLDLGALGWMADFAEWMPVDGVVLASGEDPALVHNIYPRLWQEVNNEVLRASGAPAVVYYRSGHLGSQRLAQVVWAGDQRTNFQADDGLPTVVPIGLGLAATGFPFFAHDIAGYQSSTNPPATKELFWRWTTLGALSPVMRTHHGTHARLNWNLRSDVETTTHYKRWAELHIRLFPYLWGLAHRAVARGIPLWIPMGLQHPGDAVAWAIKDQFYLGDGLLVAPVLTENTVRRDIHFPTGRYVPMFETGPAITGPTSVAVDVPLSEIALYLRGGALVPLTAEPAQTLFENVAGVPGLESTRGDRVLYVGLGAPGYFEEEPDGAAYLLEGVGTGKQGLTLDGEGAVVLTGNATLDGPDGWRLVLSGQPATRVTRVFLR
jgi:alpha-glucosidase